MSDSFSIKDLGETIAKILGLSVGDNLEVQRDKLNPNRILVIRHPDEEQKPS
ncbi:MAG: hypothetical protein ABSF09_14195 [Candidatus Bathyarchaeia archaeon]